MLQFFFIKWKVYDMVGKQTLFNLVIYIIAFTQRRLYVNKSPNLLMGTFFFLNYKYNLISTKQQW